MTQPATPFFCTFSPGIPQLLKQLQLSLAITTHQAGKLIFISPTEDGRIVQLLRTFNKPMGLSVHGNQLALATKVQVSTFINEPSLNHNYQKTPTSYDAMYAPRVTYHTGPLDLHDIHFFDNHLLAVATAFNCICRITPQESFTPHWKPYFIDDIVPEDRCHLNGLAIHQSQLFATAFNTGNSQSSWRGDILNSGVLIHCETQQLVLQHLAIPHSPRVHNNSLYMLLSGKGELIQIRPESSSYEVIAHIPAFVRGLAMVNKYAFIGISKPRKSSSTFGKLPAEVQQQNAGVVVVDIENGNTVGEIRYQSSVEEIYDVQPIPALRPNILSPDKAEHQLAVVSGNRSWWAVVEERNN